MSAPITRAMVLAAGLGTRMRARAEDPPKPLTEIAGRTLLDRLLDRLEAGGMTRIVINLHHKAERITDIWRNATVLRSFFPTSARAFWKPAAGSKKPCRFWEMSHFLSAMGTFSGRKMPIFWPHCARSLMRAAWMRC